MLGDSSCKLALLLLGYAYPAYKTYKVVHLPATRSNDSLLRHWCQYWALIAVFTAVQPLVDTFCFWLPLYYEAKLVAAIYLWANDLSGAQYVWARWAQPLVSRYEPLVDKRLAESKALAREWLHSNSLRLLAVAQQRFFTWLAQVQAQTGVGDGAGTAPVVKAPRGGAKRAGAGGGKGRGSRVEEASEDDEELDEDEEENLELERRASGRGGKKKGAAAAPAAAPSPAARLSAFSLSSFYSARSSDLQAEDVKAGLKAFPIIAEGKDGKNSSKDE